MDVGAAIESDLDLLERFRISSAKHPGIVDILRPGLPLEHLALGNKPGQLRLSVVLRGLPPDLCPLGRPYPGLRIFGEECAKISTTPPHKAGFSSCFELT